MQLKSSLLRERRMYMDMDAQGAHKRFEEGAPRSMQRAATEGNKAMLQVVCST